MMPTSWSRGGRSPRVAEAPPSSSPPRRPAGSILAAVVVLATTGQVAAEDGAAPAVTAPEIAPLGTEAVLAATERRRGGEGEEGLPYRLFLPEPLRKASAAGADAPDGEGKGIRFPVILCLHGAGGRGTDNEQQIRDTQWAVNTLASPGVQERHPSILVVPQCPPGRQWVATDWSKGSYRVADVDETPELRDAFAIFEAVLAEFADHVDRARLYLCGFSMGGYGTWDLLARRPGRFAAAVPVCGAGDPGRTAAIARSAIWAFHGDADGAVPVDGSRRMVEALEAAGASVRYTELAGVGHNAWSPAWKRADLVAWLFAQRAGSD